MIVARAQLLSVCTWCARRFDSFADSAVLEHQRCPLLGLRARDPVYADLLHVECAAARQQRDARQHAQAWRSNPIPDLLQPPAAAAFCDRMARLVSSWSYSPVAVVQLPAPGASYEPAALVTATVTTAMPTVDANGNPAGLIQTPLPADLSAAQELHRPQLCCSPASLSFDEFALLFVSLWTRKVADVGRPLLQAALQAQQRSVELRCPPSTPPSVDLRASRVWLQRGPQVTDFYVTGQIVPSNAKLQQLYTLLVATPLETTTAGEMTWMLAMRRIRTEIAMWHDACKLLWDALLMQVVRHITTAAGAAVGSVQLLEGDVVVYASSLVQQPQAPALLRYYANCAPFCTASVGWVFSPDRTRAPLWYYLRHGNNDRESWNANVLVPSLWNAAEFMDAFSPGQFKHNNPVQISPLDHVDVKRFDLVVSS